MKKLMIAAAAVALATVANAAVFNWTSPAAIYIGDWANATGTDKHKVAQDLSGKSNKLISKMDESSAISYALKLYTDDTMTTAIGESKGTLTLETGFGTTGKIELTAITIGEALEAESSYYAVGEIYYTNGDKTWTKQGTYTGTIAGAGNSAIDMAMNSNWTWDKPEEPKPTPEPTSALLMLVGVAGLALRRRRA